MFEVGETIDRYVIEGVIGQGGLAIVYKVRHKRLLTAHAMKVLFISGGPIAERLVLEGRIQANLRHPNIVHVSDVLDVQGAPVLLMDFVDGPTMKQWLSGNRPSVSQAVFLFRKITEGMAHAHAHGMIHRDLKPDNIMMAPDPKGWMPKLMDFGLAKLLDDGHSLGNTRAGATMGTPEFMSPEQVRDSADVDERADIFSLGCIFYQLLTGTSPFRCKDIVGVFNAITKEDPPKPSTLEPAIPKALDDLVLHMLAKERDNRPADCNFILDAITAIVPTLSETPAGPPTPADDPTNLPSESPGIPRSGPTSSLGSGLSEVGLVATSTEARRPRSLPPPWAGALPSEPEDPGSLTFFLPGEPEEDEDGPKDSDGDWAVGTQSKKKEWALGVIAIAAVFAALQWSTAPSDTSGQVEPMRGEVPVKPAPIPVEQAVDAAAEVPEEAPMAPTATPVETTRAPPPTPKASSKPPPAAATQSAKPKDAMPEQEATREPAPTTIQVTLTGDASSVWLTNSEGMFPLPGAVPPGQYQIKAWFGNATPVMAGSKTLSNQASATVNCNSFMERCK